MVNYKAADEADRQWWSQRIADTTVDDEFRSPVFAMADDAEPYVPAQNVAILDVCHNGVAAYRRFNAGPPFEI